MYEVMGCDSYGCNTIYTAEYYDEAVEVASEYEENEVEIVIEYLEEG